MEPKCPNTVQICNWITDHKNSVLNGAAHLVLKLIFLANCLNSQIGDFESVVTIYVDAKEWKEAFAIAEKNPEHKERVFVPYAQWLAEQDRYLLLR